MNNFRRLLKSFKSKNFIPAPIWGAASDLRYAIQRAGQWPLATFHPWRRASIRRLAALKDIHKGGRCFIIGNGPSLKQTDLSRLKDEYTFGMNRIYLMFPELGFPTTYYLSVNSLVIEQCAADIQTLPIPKFLSWRSRNFIRRCRRDGPSRPVQDGLYRPGVLYRLCPHRCSGGLSNVPAVPSGIIRRPPLPASDPIFLHTTYTGPKFARDARGRLWEGATVTYVALQLAFHMGFEQVILIGVDHSFTTQGKPNTTVVSQGDDPDHFHTSYFGKGFRWQLPDLDTSERGYCMAREAYTRAGRKVLDATIGGKLTVFPKVDYDTLF